MTTVIICEKPSQAKNMQAAVGSDPNYVILPAQGHLYRLQEPEEANPDWKRWSTDILSPPEGKYALVEARTQGRDKRISALKQALKSASSVIIATDCDREGQAIGTDIVREMRFGGPVKRAMFTNEDAITLRAAIKAAKPNSDYTPLYDAAEARRQADQIFNLSLTRIVSLCLKPKNWTKGALGVGRVKTPTFGIVCERELAIQNFVPQEYFVVTAITDSEEHQIALKHRTSNETRILYREQANKIAQHASSWSGKILSQTERKKQAPEKLMDLPTLQKRCSKWGWTATETLETAQALYDTHKISSYPRAETRYLNEMMAKDAQPILRALHALYPVSQQWDTPVIRTGKSGIFSDAGINGASHHAIIPNVNMLDKIPEIYARLNERERKLFDLIAKTYLAAVAPDYEYDQTIISIDVPCDGKIEKFMASGRVPVKLGFKELFSQDKAAEGDTSDETADEEGQDRLLPPIKNGAAARVHDTKIDAKQTTPPFRLTQGDLIDLMQNAWRFVEDPDMRERLKEAKGIGTPATRDIIITSLIGQKWIEETKGKKKYLVPTSMGLEIYDILKQNASWLIDPAFTAQMEIRLDAILEGKLDSNKVIAAISTVAEKIRDKIVQIAPPVEPSTSPSEAQVSMAERVAKDNSLELPSECRTNRAACSAFIQKYRNETNGTSVKGKKSQASEPSEKQIAFANTIASRKKKKIPAAALKDSRKLSEWINKNNS